MIHIISFFIKMIKSREDIRHDDVHYFTKRVRNTSETIANKSNTISTRMRQEHDKSVTLVDGIDYCSTNL